jgi:hypothetical protein
MRTRESQRARIIAAFAKLRTILRHRDKPGMPLQPVALKRCASCQRWQGERSPEIAMASVDIAGELATGRCQGGPWDGQERRARSACGHWTIWLTLQPNNCSTE